MNSKTSKILTHVVYFSLLISIFIFTLVNKIETDEKTMEIQKLTKRIGKQQEMSVLIQTNFESQIRELKKEHSKIKSN